MCAGKYEAMRGGKRQNRWEFGAQKFWDGTSRAFCGRTILRGILGGGSGRYLVAAGGRSNPGHPATILSANPQTNDPKKMNREKSRQCTSSV